MAPKRKSGARKAASKPAKGPSKQEMESNASLEEVEKEEDAPAPGPASVEEEKSAEEEVEPSPKKVKLQDKKKPAGRKPKAASKKSSPLSRKKATDAVEDSEEEKNDIVGEEALTDEGSPASTEAKKVIVIEASKECNCFKVRAAKVEAGLTKAIPGVQVLINPEKPRKGCFEVRNKDGNIFLSLQGLPRPFSKLKNLDMDKTIMEIIAKLK